MKTWYCGAFAFAIGISTLANCAPGTSTPLIAQTLTTEEVRLWDVKQLNLPLRWGARYRVVGKIRSITATDAGDPKIVFTGVEALPNSSVDRSIIENLAPDEYVSIECELSRRSETIFATLRGCDAPQPLLAISAFEYWKKYERNPFEADSKLRDKDIVIHGTVRIISKLTNGQDYIGLNAEEGFSDVTAVLNPQMRGLIRTYASVGRELALYCRGGARWNKIGSIGVNRCRFITEH